LVEHTTENRGVGGSIPPLTTAAPTLVLLCAPSMGILDNWLPVLHLVRTRHAAWRIVALIPDHETLAQLDATDTAHVLADELIDETIAPIAGGHWIRADGLFSAGRLARPCRAARGLLAVADSVARLAGRDPFSDRPEPHRLSPLLRVLRSRAQRDAATEPGTLVQHGARVLYDAMLHGKERIAPLMADLQGIPRHAMLHGIALLEDDGSLPPSPDSAGEAAAYLFGPSEIPAYRDGFLVPASRLHVVGVARHEPAWVTYVSERSRRAHRTPFPEFVLVVSRPAGSDYLPVDRKIRLLRELYQVAWEEHGLPLVVRTHPKERLDGTLAAAFPAEGEGTSWAISSAHPFHLAQHSRVGVVLFSGVAVDLVALGVPVIQLLDVAGLAGIDAASAPPDAHGRPRFGPYARDGLVHTADGAHELREHLARAATDREALLAPLRERYDALFTAPGGAADAIVQALAADIGRDIGRERRAQD
jgi:hypothetical protein